MSSLGTRGKWTEAAVRKQLQLYSAYSSFTFYRLPDARAGSLQPTLADFMTMHKKQLSLLECKEVANHDFRLPYKNFDNAKVGRMHAWKMAGAEGHIVLCFRPGAKTALWRYASIDRFIHRDAATPNGSWDLSDIPVITLAQVMEIMYGPPPTISN